MRDRVGNQGNPGTSARFFLFYAKSLEIDVLTLVIKPVSAPYLKYTDVLQLLFPLRDQVRVKLLLRRQLRNRAFATEGLKRNLDLERGRKPSSCLDAGASF